MRSDLRSGVAGAFAAFALMLVACATLAFDGEVAVDQSPARAVAVPVARRPVFPPARRGPASFQDYLRQYDRANGGTGDLSDWAPRSEGEQAGSAEIEPATRGSHLTARPVQGPSDRTPIAAAGAARGTDCNTNGTVDSQDILGLTVFSTLLLPPQTGNFVSDDQTDAFSPEAFRVSADDFVPLTTAQLNLANVRCSIIPNNDQIVLRIWSNDPSGWPPPGIECAQVNGSDSNTSGNPEIVLYQETPVAPGRTSFTALTPPDTNNLRLTLQPGLMVASAAHYWLEVYSTGDPSDDWGYSTSATSDGARLRRSNVIPERWCRSTAAATVRWEMRSAMPDVNNNGLPDECDDCNTNGTPDPDEPYADCNSNNQPDECDIAEAVAADCNTNNTPDGCDTDCDTNNTADECATELAGDDCNTNVVPDRCERIVSPYLVNEFDYTLDDGVQDSAIGVGSQVGPGPFIWLNHFNRDDSTNGRQELLFVDNVWGNVDRPEDCPVRVLIYEDVNTNGTPESPGDELTLDYAIPGNITVDDVSSFFTRIQIPNTVVGGQFFIAIYARAPADELQNPNFTWFPAGLDTTPPALQRSWVVFDGNDPDDMVIPAAFGADTVQRVGEFGLEFDGQWMLRGVTAIEADCNDDGTLDVCQLTVDCDTNGTLDGCETDCDTNGTPDLCDTDLGGVADVNTNNVPDICEDCDTNGTPDQVQPDYADCNTNTVFDRCEVAYVNPSLDCDTNGTPDECDAPDCNLNQRPDVCDVFQGTSEDCDSNQIPDDCQPDCNSDGTPDTCEPGGGGDCNTNLFADSCDLLPVVQSPPPLPSPFTFAGILTNGVNAFVNYVDPATGDGPEAAEDLVAPAGELLIENMEFDSVECIESPGPPQMRQVRVCLYGNDPTGMPSRPRVDPLYCATLDALRTRVDNWPPGHQMCPPPPGMCPPQVFDTFRYELTTPPRLRIPAAGTYWISMRPVMPTSDDFAMIGTASLAGAGAHMRPGTNLGWINLRDEPIINSATPPEWGLNFRITLRDDCNTNDTLDECDIAFGGATDANGDGVIDDCQDCNTNGVPDPLEVQPDCNSNGLADVCDIGLGFWPDCDTNTQPDPCQPDCDNDGTPDACQLAGADCNSNGTPDGCETDCNTNGTPESCEPAMDCNTNNTRDDCDLNPIGRVLIDQLAVSNGYLGHAASDDELLNTNGMPFVPDEPVAIADDFDASTTLSISGATFFGRHSDVISSGSNECNFGAAPGDPGAAADSFTVRIWNNATSPDRPGTFNNTVQVTAASGRVKRAGDRYYLSFVPPISTIISGAGSMGTGRRWFEVFYDGPSGGNFNVGFSRSTTPALSRFRFALELPESTWRNPFSEHRLAFALLGTTGIADLNMNGMPDECDTVCATCKGDLTGDNIVDGDDVQPFVDCMIAGGAGCGCADFDSNAAIAAPDQTAFVNKLLTDATIACP